MNNMFADDIYGKSMCLFGYLDCPFDGIDSDCIGRKLEIYDLQMIEEEFKLIEKFSGQHLLAEPP
jgi:hypothetical protein